MNNMNFSLARLLRRRGVDASLLLFDDEFTHFHPSSDTYDLEFMRFCRSLDWGSGRRFLLASRQTIREDLSAFDVLIGCGLAPAYCLRAGRQLDVFIPYGGDLLIETTFRLVRPDAIPSVWAAVASQRRGMSRAKILHMPCANAVYEERVRRYGGAMLRWSIGVPMVDPQIYDPSSIRTRVDRTHWYHEFMQVRSASDIVVMSTIRHSWGRDESDPHHKGTETLLRGLSLAIREHPHVKITLVTLEYGQDVQRSRSLIRDLGIAERVAWFPRMARKDLMVGMSLADIVCGEFGIGEFESGSRYEALVSAKPLLAFRDDAKYVQYDRLYPLMNAHSPEGIRARINEYLANPAEYRVMGQQGRRWYEECVVEAALDKYLAYLNQWHRPNAS
jgi:glycosyltransferase involved in cell wall biosynthesis